MERKFPLWLSKKLDWTAMAEMQKKLRDGKLNTICEEARCPNISDCFSKKTASFLILGKYCTRGCSFCNVSRGKPMDLDENEINEIGKIVKDLDLKYVVLTSVTRDDLPDGGASFFAKAVEHLKNVKKEIKIDVLTPDFGAKKESIHRVLDSKPDIYSHNIETVRRLTKKIRNDKSSYGRSLEVLKEARESKKVSYVKSGLMVGLGEEDLEIKVTINDLKRAGCNILTIGQYLQPNKNCTPVLRYVEPAKFEKYREYASSLGFEKVIAGPYVRSSYNLKSIFEDS